LEILLEIQDSESQSTEGKKKFKKLTPLPTHKKCHLTPINFVGEKNLGVMCSVKKNSITIFPKPIAKSGNFHIFVIFGKLYLLFLKSVRQTPMEDGRAY